MKSRINSTISSLSFSLLLEDVLNWERIELVAWALVELVLELNPMKSEGMQEALEGVHAHKHSESEWEEHKE